MFRRVLMLSMILGASAHAATMQPATRPYEVAHDKPLDARQDKLDETVAYVRYRVEFAGLRSRIPGFLYIPRDGRAVHPAVLLQYGSGGNKKTNYIVAIGQMFAEAGFTVLTIDVPGKGERKDDDPRSILAGRFLETLSDYSRAIDYLESRADVDRSRIAYVGISMGAITGITFVAHDPRVRVMVSIVGGGNFLGWLPGKIDPQALAVARTWDPYYHVQWIAPRPLLMINVTNDVLVPRFFGESLQRAAGEHAKKVWLETDHFFSTVDRAEVTRGIIAFVRENLPPAASP